MLPRIPACEHNYPTKSNLLRGNESYANLYSRSHQVHLPTSKPHNPPNSLGRFLKVIDINSPSHLSTVPISLNWSSLWHRQFWCYLRMIMCSFTMSTSSIMNPVLCKVYRGLTGSLAILWVKHMVKDSSWGISWSLEGSKNGFLVWGVKHDSTGFYLVEEAVEKFFSASWLPK